jgi:type I restriction enzyme S subunit
VRFLDWKVSRINKLISAKKKQIALLKEQKQRLIIRSVTYGLNINIMMKDSRIGWVSELPKHYKPCKLKKLAAFQSGINLTSSEISDAGIYPVYGGNGLRGYYNKFLYDGDYLLIGRQGALCGNVHHVSGQFWPTEHAVTVKPASGIDIRWFYYLLIVMDLNQYSRAAAQPGISVEYITNISTFYPPLDEQKTIASFLDRKCLQIDSISSAIKKEMTLLQEYRTRLISDVVTGKMDVRNIVVPEYEAAEDMNGYEELDGETMNEDQKGENK